VVMDSAIVAKRASSGNSKTLRNGVVKAVKGKLQRGGIFNAVAGFLQKNAFAGLVILFFINCIWPETYKYEGIVRVYFSKIRCSGIFFS